MIINAITHDRRPVYGINIPYDSVSANVEYTDDAEGMTESERRALVRSWAKHAVVNNGAVNYWLNPDNLAQKADGTASDLTGTDGDVMLMYKPIYWKVSHVDESYTSIQFADYDFDPGNTVTAHRYDNTICSYLGLGVFEGLFDSSNALRSMTSSSTPTVSKNNDQFYTASQVNRTSGHYNQMLPLTWTLYSILLLFEGGDRNTQAKWGAGYSNGSNTAAQAVSADWSATSAWNDATVQTDGTHGVTAGGIYNMWGNVWKFLGEFLKDTDGVAYFSVLGGSDHASIISGTVPDTWASANMPCASNGYVKDVTGDYNLPFIPSTIGGGSTTYWADYYYQSTSKNCGIVGGRWSFGAYAGLFFVGVSSAVGYSASNIGARLQVLIE